MAPNYFVRIPDQHVTDGAEFARFDLDEAKLLQCLQPDLASEHIAGRSADRSGPFVPSATHRNRVLDRIPRKSPARRPVSVVSCSPMALCARVCFAGACYIISPKQRRQRRGATIHWRGTFCARYCPETLLIEGDTSEKCHKRTIAGPDAGLNWAFWAGVATADVVAAPLSLRDVLAPSFERMTGRCRLPQLSRCPPP
jgi:hypothetical protein